MSLKAKLEAVIYAAEEPVTLAQLAALFAADALDWKAEQEAASAEEAAEDAEDAAANAPLLTEQFVYEEAEDPASAEGEAVQELEIEEAGLEEQDERPQPTEGSTEPVLAYVEFDIKREARQRDREVRSILRKLLDEMMASYVSDGHGVEIREIAGGFRMATKPECHDAVRLFVKSLKPALKLSLAALETLAVIAYKQPVTSPEVSEIRGVESAGVLGSLLARKLIATAGRKQVIGRPILYKTTKEFLLRFGLKDVAELPSMEEFEKMASIELDEPEEVDGGEMAPSEALTGSPDQRQGSALDSDEVGEYLPINDIDPGAVPESADTPAEQELPVAALPAVPTDPTPAVMAAQITAEAPAERAAETFAATERPVEAETSTADLEPESGATETNVATHPAYEAE